MGFKKKGKQVQKDVIDLTKTGVTLGVGSQVLVGVGGSAAPLQYVSRFMPTMGTIVGGKAVINTLKEIEPEKKKGLI